MAAQVAAAGAATQIRAVHPVTEAVAAPLSATVLKADQVVGETARVQIEVKVVPGNNQVFYRTGF